MFFLLRWKESLQHKRDSSSEKRNRGNQGFVTLSLEGGHYVNRDLPAQSFGGTGGPVRAKGNGTSPSQNEGGSDRIPETIDKHTLVFLRGGEGSRVGIRFLLQMATYGGD